MEVNKIGTEFVFGVYQIVMKFVQLGLAYHLQDESAASAAPADAE